MKLLKRLFAIIGFVLGVVVFAGCQNPAGCPSCGSNRGYVPQSYSSGYESSGYESAATPNDNQQPASGSGSRPMPQESGSRIFQGSGSR